MFDITLSGTNCTFTNTSSTIEEGASYSNRIDPSSYYYLDLSNIVVEMDGVDITSASVTMYDDYATISILSATGDISITCSAIATNVLVDLVVDNCTMTNDDTSAVYGTTYTNEITPNTGYLFVPNSVYVLVGGTKISVTSTPINIQISTAVTGPIKVCAVAVKASGVFNISDIKFATSGQLDTKAQAFSNIYVESEFSNIQVLDIIKLSTPTNLTITTVDQRDKILTWGAVDNAYGYEVRKIVGGEDSLVAEVYNRSIVLSNYLTAIGTYTLYVIALGKGRYADSNKSVNRTYTVSSIPLDAPTGLYVNNDTLYWNPVSNAYEYRVYYRRTSSPTLYEQALTTTTAWSCSLANLPYGTIELRVQAKPQNYQTYSDSPKSEDCEYVIAPIVLAAPSNLTISGKTLSWTTTYSASTISHYVVTLSNGQTITATSKSTNIGQYVNTNGDYTVTVKAIAKTISRYSDSDSSAPLEFTVSTLAAPSISIDANGLVDWSDIPHASGYTVSYRANSASWATASVATSSFDLSSHITTTGIYQVKVVANSNSLYYLDSPTSNIVSYQVDPVMLDAPVITINNSTISWPAISHASGYYVYVNNTPVGSSYITSTSYDVETYLFDKQVGTYTIFVKARGIGIYQTSEASNSVTYTVSAVQLSVPANPQLDANIFSWSAVAHAKSSYGYLVKISGDASKEFNSTTTSVDLRNHINRTAGTYNIQVKAVGWGRYIESAFTSAVTYTLTKLSTPTNVQIVDTTISLDAVTNAYGYKLYNSTTPLTANTVDFTGTSYDLANLITTAGSYSICVEAVATATNVYVDSDLSSAEEYIVRRLDTPTLTISDGVISWGAIAHAISYRIYKDGDASAWKTVSNEVTSYDVAGEITSLGTYTFTVEAYGTGLYVTSAKSNAVQYTVVSSQLATPTNLHYLGRELSWNSVTNATRYEVYCTYTSDSSVTTFTVTTTTVNLSAYLFQLGTYRIKVRAMAAGYISSEYSSTIEFIMSSVPLDTPYLTFSGSIISWDAIPYANGYRVYDSSSILFTTNNTSINVYDLTAGSYLISIVAIGGGTYADSSRSNSISVTRLETPTIALSNGIISWNAIANASSYRIYKDGGLSPWRTIAETSCDLASEIEEAGTYTFTVDAYGTGSYVSSDKSNQVTYTATSSKLSTPTNLDYLGRELFWDAVTNATRYEVYCTYVSDSSVTTFNVSTNRVNLSTYLYRMGNYTIKVRAIATGYIASNYTSEIQYTMSSTPLSAPTISRSNNIISWSAITHADGYRIYNFNTELFTTTNTSIDVYDLGAGIYSITVVAIGSDAYTDSPHSNAESVTLYSIIYNLTNCTSSNTSTVILSGAPYTSTITTSSNYYLDPPHYGTAIITMGVVDVTSTAYSNSTISLAGVAGNLSITLTPELVYAPTAPTIGMSDDTTLYIDEVSDGRVYTIYDDSNDIAIANIYPLHVTMNHCAADASNHNCMVVPIGDSVTEVLHFVPDSGYQFTSESAVVSRASSYSWNSSTGTLSVAGTDAIDIQITAASVT